MYLLFLFFSIVVVYGQKEEIEVDYSHELIYKVVKKDTLKLQIYNPENFNSSKKYPTIVFFFGGGWNGGSMYQFKDQAKYFSSRGMISVLVDYRVRNRHKTTPFESVKDAKSAIRFLRANAKKYNINPKKIVASGGSAGGHLAAATTLLDEINEDTDDLSISPKASALVLYNPVIDNGPTGFEYERINRRYQEFSPMHNIKKGVPPTIFFLGEKDRLIPVSTAYEYKDRMEAVGGRCDVFIYKNQPHGFFNKGRQEADRCYIETTREADIFLESLGYIKGKPTIHKAKELFVSKHKVSDPDGSLEKPFSTLIDAVNQAKTIKSKKLNQSVIINMQPGEYSLEESITITPELNGLIIKGTKASEVTIKGSKKIKPNWESYNENIYKTKVDSTLCFDQLLVNNKAQILARYPNYNEDGHYWQGYAADAISKDKLASWKKPEGAFFHVMHGGKWGGFHYKINGVNKDGTPILIGGQQNNRPSKPHEEYRMVENVFEELDSPGEWYLDKDKNTLYYWPQEEVNINTATFEVSVLKDLIQVVGTKKNPVKNITITDIAFKNTKRTFMEKFEPLLRSDWSIYRGAVIFFEGTENCSIKNSEFINLGGNVIMASKYNKGLNVKGNHIYNCGASAVSFVGDSSAVRSPSFTYKEFVPMAEMDTISGPKNEMYPRQCLVTDNLIHRIGRVEKQTAGVQISMAMDITVSYNSIYDVPRAGINIGDGTWGGHILEFNDVFNTVLETHDHGSFNSWGRDRFWHPNRRVMDSLTTANPNMPKWDAIKTTIIRNNRFRCDHGWDIDLDDGSSNYHIYNNLLLNNGLKLREGFNRIAENNIIVNNSLHPHVWFAKSKDVFKHNIVADTYQDVRLLGWGKELDYNFFPSEEAMLKSQIYNRDKNSAFGDPLFKNPANLDFTVADNSPALAIGFKNFPMHKFGVQKPEFKKIAKTPEVPVLKKIATKTKSPIVSWLRNNIKNIESEQEQSAYGLNTAEGVVILKVWNGSPAVKGNGIKKGDVILEASGEKVKTIKDFFKINTKNKADNLDIVVMRNQSELKLNIKVK